MGFLWQDICFGARILYRSPAHTLLAVLVLALGIGANTAIFSVTNELLVRPRPGIGAPERLVDIGRSQDGEGFDNMSYLNYADYRDRNRSFSGMFGYCLEPKPVSLSSGSGADRIFATIASGSYFSVLQVSPARGRFFTQADDQRPGERPVVVLSHAFWKRRFAADPGIVGSRLTLNGLGFTVLGVAPEGFRGTTILAPDIWVPMMMTPAIIPESRIMEGRANVWMVAIGRLKPGVPLGHARRHAFFPPARNQCPRSGNLHPHAGHARPGLPAGHLDPCPARHPDRSDRRPAQRVKEFN